MHSFLKVGSSVIVRVKSCIRIERIIPDVSNQGNFHFIFNDLKRRRKKMITLDNK